MSTGTAPELPIFRAVGCPLHEDPYEQERLQCAGRQRESQRHGDALAATLPFPVSAYDESLAAWRLANNEPVVEPAGNQSPSYRITKRVLDVTTALVLLVVLSPVILITTVVLAVTMKGRPFFVQSRAGYLGRRFPMIKFRTMRLDADSIQHEVENEHGNAPVFKNRRDPRITRIGALLRKTSIDEFPQLVNVLLGQMSMVGPRPLPVHEVARFKTWHRRRLATKPGLTCLWQVSGRSEIAFEDWVRMDLWYLKHQSLAVDLKMLAMTLWSVLTCRGAY